MITRATVSPIMRALFEALEDEVVEPVLAAHVDVVLICGAVVAAAAPGGEIEDAQARCPEQMQVKEEEPLNGRLQTFGSKVDTISSGHALKSLLKNSTVLHVSVTVTVTMLVDYFAPSQPVGTSVSSRPL
jgi:hypothetical protein